MKSKKWPWAYVFCHRMRLKHRTTLPLISSDRYDLKEACKHICEVPMTNRKVFQPLKFRHLIHKNAFLEIQKSVPVKIPLKWSPKPKNHHQLTFSFIGCDWSIARPSRLFRRVDMILRKLSNTYVRYRWPTEKIFQPLKLRHLILRSLNLPKSAYWMVLSWLTRKYQP